MPDRHADEARTMAERLADAEETLRAIRSGDVDALVVETAAGDRVFTLQGADHPYRVMVESMQEGAATVSDRGAVLYANHRLSRLLGTPLHRLIGASASTFVAADDRAAFDQLLRDAAAAGVHAEITLQSPEGSPLTAHIAAYVAASSLDIDSAHAICLVITDLSAQKRVQQDLAAANAALEQRTLELSRSNHELEQFAYIASHDLRAPLRTLSSYVELLAEDVTDRHDPKAARYLAHIEEASVRMQHLVADLLVLSRVDTSGGTLIATDVEAVLDRVGTALAAVTSETGATLTHDALPTVVVDPAQFERLLQNLVDNAIKFRADTPPRVHVTAEHRGREWRFAVSDNGIGLDPRFAEKVFVAFRRLHDSGEYPGTGIGLAICKRIVERRGGRIWVESTPGQGATFLFTIPDRKGSG